MKGYVWTGRFGANGTSLKITCRNRFVYIQEQLWSCEPIGGIWPTIWEPRAEGQRTQTPFYMKFFTRNLSIHFKKCPNFRSSSKWKKLILAYHAFQKYHTSFNLLGGLKLQFQWNSISLPRGFSVSVQCSSSNSKNLQHSSFKSREHFRKQPLSKTELAISQKTLRLLCCEGFCIFSTDFKGSKNVILGRYLKK